MRPTFACCTLALLLVACASRPSPPLVEKVIATPHPVVHTPQASAEAALPEPPPPIVVGGDAVPAVLYFAPDVYEVRDEDRAVLQAHAKQLLDHPGWRLLIEAHTDPVGPRDYNAELARMRALSVKKQLIALGVPADQLETVAYGEGSNAGRARSASALAARRRVDLKYRN